MRVRTALVTPLKVEAVERIFDLANARNLAWIFGTGHVYADLEKVAAAHNYALHVFDSTSDDDSGTWVAVRMDLITASQKGESDHVVFETKVAGLESVFLGVDTDVLDAGHHAFFILVGGEVTASDDAESFPGYLRTVPSRDGFEYAETIYRV